MNAILRRRGWLRWGLLVPLAVMYENGCAVSDAMREAADGLNNAAGSLDGKQPSEANQLIDDIQKLFE